MLLELFAILISIALVIIIIGFFSDTMVLSTIGFFFIFLLSFTLIGNNLEHQTGTTELIDGNLTTITNVYSVYSDSTKTIGIYLAIGSSVGMVLSFLSKTKKWV
jgi:hypothetical protein